MNNVITVKPHRGLVPFNLKELLTYRELFYVFIERDIKLRYRQTVIGGLWAIIQPLFTMIVFTMLFSNTAKIFAGEIPYPVFSYAGLLLWTYFAGALTNASNSMISNANLISKVYFPRIIIPVSATMTGFLDYGVASLVLVILIAYFRIIPTATLLMLPLVVFFTWLLTVGLGLWLAAVNVKYRDVRYALPFFIQLLIFFTPVIYPLESVGKYRWILKLNPMAGFIEWHRAIILGNQNIDYSLIIISILITIIIVISGIAYFKSVERFFADSI